MRWRSTQSASVDEDNPYWMSFSDIMSALLVIFILASVVLIVQLMEKQEELERRQYQFNKDIEMLRQAERVRRTILEEAAEALNNRGIKVTVSENHTVLSIPNEILGFDTREFEIRPRYKETASEIGSVLSEVIRKDNRVEYLDTVFVEGHSDNRPVSGFMGKGNWGLSTFRAISLWQYWSNSLPEAERLDSLRNKTELPLFSVSGYAETRPATEKQETEEDYRINRRIDIRFTIRRPTSEEYEAVDKPLEGF